MRIHHLNRGTMHPASRRLTNRMGGLFEAATLTCHCMLVQRLVDAAARCAPPAPPRRVEPSNRQGGAKSEWYTRTATGPRWGQIRGARWGHFPRRAQTVGPPTTDRTPRPSPFVSSGERLRSG